MAFVRRADTGAGSTQVADTVVAIWTEIERELTPIIGTRGIAALHGRSLFLASKTHPWLGGGPDGVQTAMNLSALRATVAAQVADEALAGGHTLLEVFDGLLTSMVGAGLTARLLRNVWDIPQRGPAAQDTNA